MTFAEAVAVPLGGLNALHFMRRARIKPGEQVLINGAGGHSVKVGEGESAARWRLPDSAAVRAWLADFVARSGESP